jgi:hypothetical protein
MIDNKYQGEIYSFWQLLQEQKIEIPIIQRDYAQGREDKKEIRAGFLTALYDSIVQENSIELDFIYGSKLNDIFQPLDGQQRLTTLFLLHWYAALKELKLTGYIKEVLEKFSYETRASSREFCNQLVNNFISIDADVVKISDLIVDSSWFFLAWKKDPTIDAMLRAIDDIHQRFCKIDNIWGKLTSDKAIISFYYVELGNFGLTDDLYIKMNSRGKLLTAFENFKATFQKQIDNKKWDNDKNFSNSFACKVDGQWTDLFWSHRKENRIDEAFIRFISAIAMIRIVLEKSEEQRFRKLSELNTQSNTVKIEYLSEDGYKYLYESLDIYCQIYDKNISLELDFPLWQHLPNQNIFTTLVYEESSSSNNATYTQKALFYAQTEYLIKVTIQRFDEEKFRYWMRVVRNIISRGDAEKTGKRPSIVRSPETFDGVINLINELSEGCDDIYTFLSTHAIKSSFAKSQVEEEKLKAKLIIENDSYKEVIFATEDTSFCQGRIEFPLYCIDYDELQNNFDYTKLAEIQKVIEKYIDKEITNDFRRALLTISDDKGNYSYYNYWWSFSYAVNSNKRCLIDKYYELEYYVYGNYNDRNYCKEYLKKLLLQLITKNLEEIISDFVPPDDMPNWKVRLIKESNLLERCKSNYIAIPKDESCCYLLKGIRPRDIDDCEKIE